MKATEKKHATYSASGASRWLACPGSIELSKNAPPQRDSPYALEGTEAHECLEMFLKNGRPKITQTAAMLAKAHPLEMVDHAQQAAIYIWKHQREGDLLCETKVDLSFVAPGMFGTVDAAIVDIFGTLHVFDFKYGAGIPVDPDDNPQLIYYALGIAHQYDFDFQDVVLHIVQPRAEHDSGTERSWRMSVEDLQVWEKKFRKGVEACEDPGAEFNPGDHCRFCPAKSLCPAIADQAFHQAEINFQPIADKADGMLAAPERLPATSSFTPAELARVLPALPRLRTWIDAVESVAQDLLENGHEIKGYKLVQKRSTRKWADIEKATKAALSKWRKDIFTTPVLLSPAQLEKKFGKEAKAFTKLHTVDVVPDGHTMVEDSDPRPAISTPEDHFDEVENLDEEISLAQDDGYDWAREDAKTNRAKAVSEADWRKREAVKRNIKKKKFAAKTRKITNNRPPKKLKGKK